MSVEYANSYDEQVDRVLGVSHLLKTAALSANCIFILDYSWTEALISPERITYNVIPAPYSHMELIIFTMFTVPML